MKNKTIKQAVQYAVKQVAKMPKWKLDGFDQRPAIKMKDKT